jgi:hypothetical protein
MTKTSALIPLDEARRQHIAEQRQNEIPDAEPPRPLMRELPPADPYPVEHLGEVLGPAALAIHDRVQAPPAICAQSVLAAATMAVQAHADVVLPIGPNGQARPISNFYCTIAASGERKTACDAEATRAIRDHEMWLREKRAGEMPGYLDAHDAWRKEREIALKKKDREDRKAALDACGPEPKAPLQPLLLAPDPTYEGLCRLFAVGQPALGLFSSEGSQFIGGYGMADAKLRTAGGLSSAWDAEAIRRVRAGEDVVFLPGRRLTAHLMVQPDVAALLCGDRVLADQGLLSRLLVTAPESAAGTRFRREENPTSAVALRRYDARLGDILRVIPPLAEGTLNELRPRRLLMSHEAQQVWEQFADHVEGELGRDGSLCPVQGLANKLPEHAARIAAVRALIEDLGAAEVSAETMSGAIVIAQHYAAEALRLFGGSRVNPDLLLAQRLLEHLQTNWSGDLVSLPDIYQRTLNAIGDQSTASRIVRILVVHGWLVPIGRGVVGGRHRRETWRIVRVPHG